MKTLDLCKKLITYKSVTNDSQECNKILDFVIGYFKKENPKIYFKEFVHKGRRSLLFTTKDSFEIDFLMVGHLDVVSGEDSLFKPKQRNGLLYGRGACDMKGTVSAMIQVILNVNSEKNIALFLSVDEEEGGVNGAGYFSKINELSYEVVFVPDSLANWTLTVAQKGVEMIKLRTFGKCAHSSEPWEGSNAVERLILNYQKLLSSCSFGCEKDDSTIVLTKIVGGEAMNQIPGYAELIFDFRYFEKKDREKLFGELKKLSKKEGVDYEVVAQGNPVCVRENNPFIKKFTKMIARNKINYVVGKECGTSDVRYFCNAKACIMFMPLCGGAHECVEWVDIESLYTFEKLAKEFIEENL